jgi:hypothetical protein
MNSLVFRNKQGREITLNEMTVNMTLENSEKYDVKKELKYLQAIFEKKQSITDKSERLGGRTNQMYKSQLK